MVKCHLKGKQWGHDNGSYRCTLRPSIRCKLCNLTVCFMHSIPCDNVRICDLCVSSLPIKTVDDMIGKGYFSDETIRRIERIYLTTTKACKQ